MNKSWLATLWNEDFIVDIAEKVNEGRLKWYGYEISYDMGSWGQRRQIRRFGVVHIAREDEDSKVKIKWTYRKLLIR